ncbi:hypothetical protein [Amycolatopsis sp. DSM 110486]|uniref:hypothetical protein n=1 Tax=Amycolatopsis sp. DSM 110486 TaxID=2865832 RepID=UPI001C69AEAF|nr:hypothetical protein [Amycolatopsis sp. DSM 110486]QYN17626.1 hypothetical protein K1T34_33105 [Amycolatopsis sp. DSM 110486]
MTDIRDKLREAGRGIQRAHTEENSAIDVARAVAFEAFEAGLSYSDVAGALGEIDPTLVLKWALQHAKKPVDAAKRRLKLIDNDLRELKKQTAASVGTKEAGELFGIDRVSAWRLAKNVKPTEMTLEQAKEEFAALQQDKADAERESAETMAAFRDLLNEHIAAGVEKMQIVNLLEVNRMTLEVWLGLREWNPSRSAKDGAETVPTADESSVNDVLLALRDYDQDFVLVRELGRMAGLVPEGREAGARRAAAFSRLLRSHPWNLPDEAFKRTKDGVAVSVPVLRKVGQTSQKNAK